MVNTVFLASLVTVVPAMGALMWFLRRYEGYFEDARLFFALIVGLFAGLFAAAFEFFTDFGAADFSAAAGSAIAFLFFVVGYAFFEAGLKTMILGLGRFKTRRDTPYYGLSLGLAMGAMISLMVVANGVRRAADTGNDYQLLPFVLLVLLAVGIIFAGGATGVWVAKGSADGKLWRGWGYGTLLYLPITGCLWIFWPSLAAGNVVVAFPGVVASVYGAGLLVITDSKILAHVVPKEIADKVRREQRREARAAQQTGPVAANAAPLVVIDESE